MSRRFWAVILGLAAAQWIAVVVLLAVAPHRTWAASIGAVLGATAVLIAVGFLWRRNTRSVTSTE